MSANKSTDDKALDRIALAKRRLKSIDAQNQRLREESGSVTSNSRLVSFLYEIMRDYVLPADIEKAMQNTCPGPSDKETRFVNGYLAGYAENIAERLTEK